MHMNVTFNNFNQEYPVKIEFNDKAPLNFKCRWPIHDKFDLKCQSRPFFFLSSKILLTHSQSTQVHPTEVHSDNWHTSRRMIIDSRL